ncbi:MAG: zf-HC2 domain-containing protein [Chloroflexota bacterium]
MASEQPVPCEEVMTLIEAYAIGATDVEETQFVEEHLADCPKAVAALVTYRDIVEAWHYLPAITKAQQPDSIPPLNIPLRVEKQIGTTHHHTLDAQIERIPPLNIVTPSNNSEAHNQETVGASAPPLVSASRPVFLLVASLLLILLIGSNALLLWQNNQLNIVLEDTRELLDIAAVQPSPVPTLLATEVIPAPVTLTFTNAANSRTVSDDIDVHGSVEVIFTWDTNTQVGSLYIEGLEVSAPERLYQLWLIDGETVDLVGQVTVNEDEQGSLIFQSSTPIDSYSTFLITTEPDNDASKRTPLISGQL